MLVQVRILLLRDFVLGVKGIALALKHNDGFIMLCDIELGHLLVLRLPTHLILAADQGQMRVAFSGRHGVLAIRGFLFSLEGSHLLLWIGTGFL